MNPNVAIAIAFVVGVLVGAVVMYAAQRARTIRLKKQFGPEYGRVIADTGIDTGPKLCWKSGIVECGS